MTQLLTPREMSTLRRRYVRNECIYGAVLAVIVLTYFVAFMLTLVRSVEVWW